VEKAAKKRRWRRPRILAARPRAAGGMPLSPAEIRELRGSRTRLAFARQLGVSTATVYFWEAARRRPSPPNLARLMRLVARARALGGRTRTMLRPLRTRRPRP
jgi:DNA-binding transcriptional regulator YiaG